MISKFSTDAAEYLCNLVEQAKTEAANIRWFPTIIIWTWHIATRVFLVFAVGFFAADILILLSVWHGGGWESLNPALAIPPHEVAPGAKAFLNFKNGCVLMVAMAYPLLSIMSGGFGIPKASRKSTYPTATAMLDSRR